MLVDIHLHTSDFSACSQIIFEEAVQKAKHMGLDGICVTDHESRGWAGVAEQMAQRYDILIIVGVEILTYEGDILVYGVKELPQHKMHAQDLIDYVAARKGAAVAAHPFRDNGRGLGKTLAEMVGLTGIEVYNGNTTIEHNNQAYFLAQQLGLPLFGGSDAHRLSQVGCYATLFEEAVSSEEDLVREMSSGSAKPVYFNHLTEKYELMNPKVLNS